MKKICDYGRTILGAKKDKEYYSQKHGEYRVNISSIWPKSKIRSQNKFVRYLVNVLRQDIRRNFKNKDQAEKFVIMVTKIRDSLLDIEESDEFFRVIRQVQYAMDSNGQPLYDLDLLFGDHGISYSKMNHSAMLASGFEKSPEEIAKEKVETKLWFLRFDWETKFNENLNLIEIEIPYEYDLITIHIPASISFCEQEWEGYFIVEWDEKKERRFVSMINASQGDYDLRAAEMYKKELEKLKPPKKHSSRIKIDQTANPGAYEGPDYLEGFFPKEDVFIQKFGIAGQFGNSFTQAERRKVMPKLYRSCANLARVLGCTPKNLALPIGDKNLGVALGARGHGGLHSASAHYEPAQHVINITRSGTLRGGSFAHEFLHGVDHFLFNKLVSSGDESLLTDLPAAQLADILPEMAAIIQFICDPTTRFYQDALSLDLMDNRKTSYFASPREAFARAGSSSIIKLLGQKSIRDDFLAWDFMKEVKCGSCTISACPTGAELEHLTCLYQKLFDAIIQKGLWQPLAEEDLYLRAVCQRGPKHPLTFGTQMSFSF